MKISCVMTTYRRFTCVNRSIACFLSQDFYDKELIIYNTDIQHPLSIDPLLAFKHNIRIINSDTDTETGESYTNTGAIRRDARQYATGELYITWDDDDIFFPWNLQQCYDGITRTGARAWKPHKSMFKQPGHLPEINSNYFEASVIVYNDEIDRYGFNLKSGPEHLSWFTALKSKGQLIEDENSIPAYCFYWADPPGIAGHKQSNAAEIEKLDNFQRHKILTTDYAKGPLSLNHLNNYPVIINEFKSTLHKIQNINPVLFDRYIKKHTYLL